MISPIEVSGLEVVVVGRRSPARRVVRRLTLAGARVTQVTTPTLRRLPHSTPADRPGLVVAVPDEVHDAEVWGRVLGSYRELRVPVMIEPAAGPGGRVTLVGGGPGPVDLLTVRAIEALRDADVVFFDRLGPTEGLDELTGGARLIDVGKSPGHHRVPQSEIEARMVETAERGEHVVRLKGGDPFVFGRGSEEIDACVEAGIPVTVVPGISSAISVPGAAGIPVTRRGAAHAFTVVSGHAPLSADEHRHLAGLGGTIIVLMGMGTLPHLVSGLRSNGLGEETPVAVVERGFAPDQATTLTMLGEAEFATVGRRNPAVVVIGEVVRAAGARGAADLARAVLA